MPITLAGVEIPDQIQWVDEFAGFGVGQQITATLTGALLIEENAQPDGRPITLESGAGAWATREQVEALDALAATPIADGATLPLVWATGETFDVVFDRSSGNGFSAEEIIRVAPAFHSVTHPYAIKLSLLVKG